MKRLLKRLLLFSLPACLMLVPLFVLVYSGEFLVNYRSIIKGEEKYIFGLAYSEVGRQFKFANLETKNKFSVVALGSSRVQQFRQEMLNKPFYNASGTIQSIYEFKSFLNALPEDKIPDYLIIGLDQWMFNAKYQREYEQKKRNIGWSDFSEINSNLDRKIKSISIDLVNGKIDHLFKDNECRFYGITAIVDSSGFRNDGSYVYQALMRKLLDPKNPSGADKFKNTFERIKNGCCRFQHEAVVDRESVAELERLLKFCSSKNIEVISFLPPFASDVFKKMSESGNYLYMDELYGKIKPIFDLYNYELHDFSDFKVNNNPNDEMMIDGYHGGELIYMHIMLNILNSGSKLNRLADFNEIRSHIENSPNTLMVYPYY